MKLCLLAAGLFALVIILGIVGAITTRGKREQMAVFMQRLAKRL